MWAKWGPASIQFFDHKKMISFTTSFLKGALVITGVALTLITLPCATISLFGYIAVEWAGVPFVFRYNYRAIEVSPANDKGFQIATSYIAGERRKESMRSDWTDAVEHAKQTGAKTIVLTSDAVDLLQSSISRNENSSRDLIAGSLVEGPSGGGSDAKSMEKERLFLSSEDHGAVAERKFMSQFGPIQSCNGIPLFKTLMSQVHMASAPSGPCTHLALVDKINGFYTGLEMTVVCPLIVLLFIFWAKKNTQLLIEVIDEKIQKRAGEVTANKEARQLGETIKPAVSAPTRRPRL